MIDLRCLVWFLGQELRSAVEAQLAEGNQQKTSAIILDECLTNDI